MIFIYSIRKTKVKLQLNHILPKVHFVRDYICLTDNKMGADINVVIVADVISAQ